MANIFLIRHGEAAASWGAASDPGLSPLGQQQAAASATAVAPHFPTTGRILSSPLRRAQQTARPLSELTGRPVEIVTTYTEIPSPVPRAERAAWLRSIVTQRWAEQQRMVQDWRDAILQELQTLEEPTAIYTHFMVLNVIVGAVTSSETIVCFQPDNGSITKLRMQSSSLQLVRRGRERETVVN